MSLLDFIKAMTHRRNSLQKSCWNWRKLKMIDLESNKNVARGSVLKWKGVVCEFGTEWLVYESYHIGKI
jgi:hypothetical protein